MVILIDGNYLMHSEYSVFAGYGGGKSESPLKSDRDQADFMQGVSTKFFHILSVLPVTSKIVFCIDSRSWRKSVIIPDGGYKSSREDKDGNKGSMTKETKDIFYNLISEFSSALKSAGIMVSKVEGAEGDDLLYKWVKKMNSLGESCIVVSGDKDLAQVVKGGDVWTIVWNNNSQRNKIYALPEWSAWLSQDKREQDIFSFSVIDEAEEIRKMLRVNKIPVEIMDVDRFMLNKVLLGDDGDDVPAVWKIKKGDKFVRVTPKPAAAIIEAFDKLGTFTLPSFYNDESSLDILAGVILRVMGDIDGKDQRAAVIVCLKRNLDLMWLSDIVIPGNVAASIDDNITDNLQMLDVDGVDRSRWSRMDLLKETRFSGEVVPKEFDPSRFAPPIPLF